jgi:hypothetical protein
MPWSYLPELAYSLEAQTILREMDAQGILLTLDQAHELAHARLGPSKRWVAQEPTLPPEGRVVLDQILADRQAQHDAQGGYPQRRQDPEQGLDRAVHGGQDALRTRQQPRKRRLEIRDFLKESNDPPDERWR